MSVRHTTDDIGHIRIYRLCQPGQCVYLTSHVLFVIATKYTTGRKVDCVILKTTLQRDLKIRLFFVCFLRFTCLEDATQRLLKKRQLNVFI